MGPYLWLVVCVHRDLTIEAQRGCIRRIDFIDFIEIGNHDLLLYLFYLFSIPHTKPATTGHNPQLGPQPTTRLQQQTYQSWQPRSMASQMAI